MRKTWTQIVLVIISVSLFLTACNRREPETTQTPNIQATIDAAVAATAASKEDTGAVDRQGVKQTEIPFQIVVVPVNGDDGKNSHLHSRRTDIRNGQNVFLPPSFTSNKWLDPPTFRNEIGFRVEVFDDRVGTTDGAGIDRVEFEIRPSTNGRRGNGAPVFKRIEVQAGYCIFGGGDPSCPILPIGNGRENRWPATDGNQTPIGGGWIANGDYLAQIDIFATNGDSTQWRWDFRIDNPALPN